MDLIQRILDAGFEISSVYIDTVGTPQSYEKKLSSRFPSIKFTVAKKADALYPIVSAASICAKVLRDLCIKNWVFKENDHLDKLISSNMGSGYPSDPVTVRWLKANIDYVFGYSDIVRFSWSTCSKILEEKAAKVKYNTQDEKDLEPQHFKKRTVLGRLVKPEKNTSLHNTITFNKNFKTNDCQSLFLKENKLCLWSSL
ncbi:hypothetical protein BB561_000354 [Smittium simulii]|uniref:Ribonuclease n=1 Tax=Smittium simulii TaxID=133385 RepID=A0A2T9YZH4_9FUNG|nr:hypothetical protein BB561_000354 [Smittium simulii]